MTRTMDLVAELSAPEAESTAGVTLADVIAGVLERAEAGEPIVDALPLSVELLDDVGLARGGILVVAGGPGAGKSTFADGLVLDALRLTPDADALIVALETTPAVRAARMLSAATVLIDQHGELRGGVGTRPLLRGELRPEGLEQIRAAAGSLVSQAGTRLRFVDTTRSASEITALIRAERPALVVLDHLGLVEAPAGVAGVEAADMVMGMLHDAAVEANCALVLLSEVSKAQLKSPTLGIDAPRGSARVASLATTFVTIAREDDDEREPVKREPVKIDPVTKKPIPRDPTLRLSLVKSRHGPAGRYQFAVLLGGLGCLRYVPGVHDIKTAPKRKRGAS